MIDQLPDSIRVGPYDFAIRVMPSLEAHTRKVRGECSYPEQLIRVREGMSSIATCDTFLHELEHAIWWVCDLDEDVDQEERIVSTVSTARVQVYRDNPWLLEWIGRCVGAVA